MPSPPNWLLAAMAVAVLVVLIWRTLPNATHRPSSQTPSSANSPGTISYFGHNVKLTRDYSSYEDYQDDPNNIDPSENARVYDLVAHAPVGHTYANRRAFTQATLSLKFPGYGAGFSGLRPQPDGSSLELVDVEIPRSGKSRFLAFQVRGETYTLIDDFVEDDAKKIVYVQPTPDGQLSYYTDGEHLVLTRRPEVTPPTAP